MTTATRTARTSAPATPAPAKGKAKLGGQSGTAALLSVARARADASKALRADALAPLALADAASRLSAALAELRKLATDPRQTADYIDANGDVKTDSVASIVGKLGGDRASVILTGALKLAK